MNTSGARISAAPLRVVLSLHEQHIQMKDSHMSANASASTEASSSRFVKVRDGEAEFNVHYNDVGPASGQTVVMLHGSGPGATGWANFHRNIDAFAAGGYRVLLIDMPGWGKSDAFLNTGGSRSDFNGRIVKLVLDHLGIERAHVVGNSMGGHSATAFALANPERIGKLVLMGGGTGGPSQFVPMPTEGIKLLNHVYREPTLENVKRMMNVFVYDAARSLTSCCNCAWKTCWRGATIWKTGSRVSRHSRSNSATTVRALRKSRLTR